MHVNNTSATVDNSIIRNPTSNQLSIDEECKIPPNSKSSEPASNAVEIYHKSQRERDWDNSQRERYWDNLPLLVSGFCRDASKQLSSNEFELFQSTSTAIIQSIISRLQGKSQIEGLIDYFYPYAAYDERGCPIFSAEPRIYRGEPIGKTLQQLSLDPAIVKEIIDNYALYYPKYREPGFGQRKPNINIDSIQYSIEAKYVYKHREKGDKPPLFLIVKYDICQEDTVKIIFQYDFQDVATKTVRAQGDCELIEAMLINFLCGYDGKLSSIFNQDAISLPRRREIFDRLFTRRDEENMLKGYYVNRPYYQGHWKHSYFNGWGKWGESQKEIEDIDQRIPKSK